MTSYLEVINFKCTQLKRQVNECLAELKNGSFNQIYGESTMNSIYGLVQDIHTVSLSYIEIIKEDRRGKRHRYRRNRKDRQNANKLSEDICKIKIEV